MANITLLGASYTDVPAVDLPQTGGGTVRFYEDGGGSSGYTRTVIVPQQSVTPAYADGFTKAVLSTASGTLVEGADYIITFNGDEFWFTCVDVGWGDFAFVGVEGFIWGTGSDTFYPCTIMDSYGDSNNLEMYVYDGYDGTPVTIKVERIELTGSGGGGGASNLVTGTFTGTTTGTAMDIVLPYTGNGYPIAVVIYPSRSNISTFNSLIQRYVIRDYCADKMNNDEPSYSSTGNVNSGYVCLKYKSSASNSTSYSNGGGSGTVNVYNDTSATASSTLAVQIRSKTKMSVFIASTSYGFAANIEYTYRIIYSE